MKYSEIQLVLKDIGIVKARHKIHEVFLEQGWDRETCNLDEVVKKLHFLKILESQAIVIVSDASNYFGNSTMAEMAFSERRGIPIFYFDGEKFSGETSRTPLDKWKDTSLIDEFAENYGGLGF